MATDTWYDTRNIGVKIDSLSCYLNKIMGEMVAYLGFPILKKVSQDPQTENINGNASFFSTTRSISSSTTTWKSWNDVPRGCVTTSSLNAAGPELGEMKKEARV